MNSIFQESTERLNQLSSFVRKQRENSKLVSTFEVAITFLLISFFLFFAIKPTALTIASLYGEIKSKEVINEQLKTKINNLMKAQEAYSLIQGRYQVIESSLPSRPGFYEAFDQVKETLNNSGTQYRTGGFDLSKIDDKGNVDPNIRTYSLSLTIKNSFENSLKVITDLLSNRRLINISSISFHNDVDNKDNTNQTGLTTSFAPTFFYWQK